MKNYLLLALLALAAAVGGGCSVRVDVADENTAEKSRVAVEVGFLVDQKSEPAPAPPVALEKSETVEDDVLVDRGSEVEEKPASRESQDVLPARSAGKSVVRNVVNIYNLDMHRHNDVHYHYETPRKSREKSVKVRVEVVQKPARDERCEKLMLEHQRRIAKWEQMMRADGR